jgi:hypothetical protein
MDIHNFSLRLRAMLTEILSKTPPKRKIEKQGIHCLKSRIVKHVLLELILKASRKNE